MHDERHLSSLEQESSSPPFIVEAPFPQYVERENLPLIFSETDSLEDWEQQISSLPKGSFEEERDKEFERLGPLISAFTSEFGFNILAIARTRTEILATILKSSALIVESRFNTDEPTHSPVQDGTFFDGRRHAGKIQLNANGAFTVGENTITFSVLKDKNDSASDPYEVDYAAYSIPRSLLQAVMQFQEVSGKDVVSPLQNLLSWRVHDWLHQAILYDVKSKTSAFQDWADDSFFVQHLVPGEGRINYELLTTHLHFRCWQELFEKDPAQKQLVLNEAVSFMQSITEFQKHLESNGGASSEKAHDAALALAYLGIRGLVDIIPYNDPDFQLVLNRFPLFLEVLQFIPDESKRFLKLAYDPNLRLPFRKGQDVWLTVPEILKEYQQALEIERRAHVQEWQTAEWQKSDMTYSEIMSRLPANISRQMQEKRLQKIPYPLDLLRQFGDIPENFTPEKQAAWQALADRTHLDASGLWFLELDQKDLDFSQAQEVIQQKTAIVIQIPHDYEGTIRLPIKRRHTLLSEHTEAFAEARAGEAVIFNCWDVSLAQSLLDQANSRGSFDALSCIENIIALGKTNKVDVVDIYPMSATTATRVFSLNEKHAVRQKNEQQVITPGFYRTSPNKRLAYRADAIAMDSGRNDGERRKSPEGAAVQNSSSQDGTLDVFPVLASSYMRIYDVPLSSLPDMQFSPEFSSTVGGEKLRNSEVQQLTTEYLHLLRTLNSAVMYGKRGKPNEFSS